MVDQTGTNNWNMNKPYLITMKFKLIKCSYNAQNKLKIQSNNLYSNINKHTAALQINCLTQHSQCCHYSISINVTSLMRLWLRWSQALLAWSKTIKSQQRQSLFTNNVLLSTELTELRFYIPLNTKQVISETFFLLNLLA